MIKIMMNNRSFLAVFGLFLAGVSGASHFPARYSEDPNEEQNNLSPIRAVGGGPGPLNWVNVVQKTGRVISVAQGRRVELECEASGDPSPSIQWYRGSRPITPLQAYEETNTIGGARLGKVVSKYVIECALPIHQGTYTCSAIAGVQRASTPPTAVIVEVNMSESALNLCLLNKDKPPQITVTRPMALETTDNDVFFPCTASGHPKPKVFWLDKNEQIIENNRDSRFKVLDSGDLVISKIRWTDMGVYKCIAENKLGTDTAFTFLYPLKNEV